MSTRDAVPMPGPASQLVLTDFNTPPMRAFHMTWMAFFLCFFAWFGIAMLLYGLQSVIYFVSGNLLFGLAPLHALGIGFFSGMILAMASRVTLGHSGRPLELDRATWLLFLGFQATAVIRIVADLVPAMAAVFYLLAALVWLGCFGMWAFRFAPIYWRARVDGKPG